MEKTDERRCEFCKALIHESAWCITFGNSPLLGRKAVDAVCPDCILEGFRELEKLRLAVGELQACLPEPFELNGYREAQ